MPPTITKFLFALLISSITGQPSPYGFKNQFINTQHQNQPDLSTFCDNFWCINDANMLFTQSSQYNNVDPCVDFRNFTLSSTIEISQVNDRKMYRGLLLDAEEKLFERVRKVLSAKITENDNKIVSIVKSTFQQCLKSPHTFRHVDAHRDVIDYLVGFGGSPYLSQHLAFNPNKFDSTVDYKANGSVENVDWNAENFKFDRIIAAEPNHVMSFSFDRTVERCRGGILCFQQTGNFAMVTRPNFYHDIMRDMLEALEDFYQLSPQLKQLLSVDVFVPATKRLENFVRSKQAVLDEFGSEEAVLVKVGKLKGIGGIDWMKVINGQLMRHSWVNEEDEILMQPKLFEKLVENVLGTDIGTLADSFVLTFLYSIRHSIILRFFNIQDSVLEGRKQNLIRSERCLKIMSFYVQPAINLVYERDRPFFDYYRGDFNRNSSDRFGIIEGAREMVEEVLEVMKNRVVTGSNFPLTVGNAILKKLKSAKIIVGFTNETLKMEELETFYQDLRLNGSESFMMSIIEMRINSWKIRNEIKGSWRSKIEHLGEIVHTTYQVQDGNYLFVPQLWVIYPVYHPLRARFFNMATFYQGIVYAFTVGIVKYVNDNFHYKINDSNYNFEDNYQLTYEVYSDWLKSHSDLKIGANSLSDKQLYWVAVAVSKYLKYHRNVPKSYYTAERVQIDYLHVWMKRKPGFQDAYNCSLTEQEKATEQEYINKHKAAQDGLYSKNY